MKKESPADELLKNLLLDELNLAMQYINNSLKSIESELAIESLTFMKNLLEKSKI